VSSVGVCTMFMKSSAQGFSGAVQSVPKRMPRREPLLEADGLIVELVPVREASDYGEAWRQLAARALEPNIFAEADVVLSGAQHLEDGRQVAVLFIWAGSWGEAGKLRGVFPLLMPRWPLWGAEVSVWRPLLSPNGLPLIDRTQPEETLKAAFDALALAGMRLQMLRFSGLDSHGPLAQALLGVMRATGRPLLRRAESERPFLSPQTMPRLLESSAILSLRQLRREGGSGLDWRFERVREGRAVRDAVEEFLALDAAQEDRSKPALIDHIGSASFVRAMTRRLARDKRCRVETLRLDGCLAASAILLESKDQHWIWRIATHPAFADLEPDRQLVLHLSQDMIGERRTRLRLDLCQDKDHDRLKDLWPDSCLTTHLAIATRPDLIHTALHERVLYTLRRAVFLSRKGLAPSRQITAAKASQAQG
jgi:hypothetical protein